MSAALDNPSSVAQRPALDGNHGAMTLLTCSHCHFGIRPRADFLAPDYCPRCLAKRHRAEPMSRHTESARSPVMHQHGGMVTPPLPQALPAGHNIAPNPHWADMRPSASSPGGP